MRAIAHRATHPGLSCFYRSCVNTTEGIGPSPPRAFFFLAASILIFPVPSVFRLLLPFHALLFSSRPYWFSCKPTAPVSFLHLTFDPLYQLPPHFFSNRPGRHMFVGISERTNEAGAAALSKAFGASLPVIPVPVVSEWTKRVEWIARGSEWVGIFRSLKVWMNE